jgi:hypothetical protein
MSASKPKFAVLGWGSLLWDERPEFAGFSRRLTGWYPDGPTLRLEFARVSSSRDGALTLVLVEAPLGADCHVSYALIERTELEDALCDLRCREGCNIADIGYCRIAEAENQRARDATVVGQIRKWGAQKNLDAVIWTDLPANFSKKSDPRADFSIPAALAHLQKRSPKGKSQAAEYVWRTPEFVKTPLRLSLQAIPWFAPPPLAEPPGAPPAAPAAPAAQ